jgi:hypothetical protein
MRRVSRLVGIVLGGALVAGALAQEAAPVGAAAPQDCAWVSFADAENSNVVYPDTSVNYYLARVAVPAGGAVLLRGRYPHARYTAFNAYDEIGRRLQREPLRRDQAVARGDQLRDLGPVRSAVELHPYPALVADVGRHEEALGVGADQHHLTAGRRLAPERDAPVAPLLHGEDLAAHAVGRVAPGLLLHRLGQGEADRPQPFGGRSAHRFEAPFELLF